MDITIPRIIKNWRFSPNIEFTKNFEENKVSLVEGLQDKSQTPIYGKKVFLNLVYILIKKNLF